MEKVLEKCLKDQATLMEQGFKEKAAAMEEKITDLKTRLNERKESSGGILCTIDEILSSLIPTAINRLFSGRKK